MDDVLERAEAEAKRAEWSSYRVALIETDLLRALAAEVRELRKDRERLEFLEHGWIESWGVPYRRDDGNWMIRNDDDTIGPAATIRDVIDAAMASRGEDA